MSSEENIPNGWIKVKSKSRPEMFYYYNKEKKLSVWKVEDCKNALKVIAANDVKKTPKKSPQKLLSKISETSKKILKKNIAEDRMKRLRSALSEEVKRGIECKNKNEKISKANSFSLKNSLTSPIKLQSQQSDSIKCNSNNGHTTQEKDDSVNSKSINSNTSKDESMEIDEQQYENSKESQEVEPMEWEEIDEKIAVEEVHSVRSKDCEETTVNCTNKRIKSSDNEFYIIVDTNVFLSNLKLIREIKGMYFKGIGKAVIYLPYVVLCELDRLKMREENVARQARAAINYINNCFSDKDEYLIGQSALESSRAVIEIDNGDDYIINSGLQLKDITNKIIVLSNDKNLRNKIAVNELEAFSSDMLIYANFNEAGKIKFD